ncbi:GL15196 [Drosophila persimilis]|uniref:NADH dehydrogenase [ubiquinone] 1 alpha subcomplex subunit 2 n=2 Tax=pseudoobscura subgroup TaxID=32358 RepID=Q29LK3_DROPS|nr:NADH dehydrogenase [ubiquinone] 1 alpha subcomplex subunit 2 [Drosophila pseudoobscura]XP_002020618.1 NADH dehydrogenase [ubiquinone] 1 alpha subcomplex subunit 2 [Drosophila persimilis]EDW39611.1 GL15196 [Drosophila persimilis]
MRLTLTRLAALTPKLKELRIVLDPTGDASKGAREFVQKFYPNLKRDNPNLPIMVRECAGAQPRLWARYGKGKEISVSLTNREAPDIQKQLEAVGK